MQEGDKYLGLKVLLSYMRTDLLFGLSSSIYLFSKMTGSGIYIPVSFLLFVMNRRALRIGPVPRIHIFRREESIAGAYRGLNYSFVL